MAENFATKPADGMTKELLSDFLNETQRAEGKGVVETVSSGAEGQRAPLKVLFVCNWNMNRSQTAQYFFNKEVNPAVAVAASAGVKTSVNADGKKLGEFYPNDKDVQETLKNGVDISENRLTRLTEEIFNGADVVVSMVPREGLPIFAQDSGKVRLWEFEFPNGWDATGINMIRESAQRLAQELELSKQKAKI